MTDNEYTERIALRGAIDQLRKENSRLRTALKAADEKYQPLVEALAPILAFIEAFDERPRAGLADEIYAVDGRTDIAIRSSDLRKLREALKKVQP